VNSLPYKVFSADCRNCNQCPSDDNGVPMIFVPGVGCKADCTQYQYTISVPDNRYECECQPGYWNDPETPEDECVYRCDYATWGDIYLHTCTDDPTKCCCDEGYTIDE
jgi:hypothetical protein